MKKRFIGILLLLLFNSLSSQAEIYSFKSPPTWIKTVEIPNKSSISKYDIADGFYSKLVDQQINLEEKAFYFREVRNVISFSGITNASQLLVTYDTSYQHLQVHHLYIWRNGKKIDRTKDLSLEVLNNEYNLQQGIYTGDITAYDNLDDIRKDDLIDFAYSLIGTNPIFGDDKYLFIPLATMNPIDLYTLRILYPKEKTYYHKCVECDSLKVVDREIENYREIQIDYLNLKALQLEENIPSWLTPYPYFALSSYNSWKDVNRWAQSVFALNEQPKLDAVFDEIFTGNETTEQKISKLIDYVQDDIRYMGIESGIGSIKPFHPEQVVKQRFGDCKDKSLLLVSLLKNIGVDEAYPALVNTVAVQNIENFMVSNQIFNHCIVTFDYDGQTFWVDPTVSLQGGNFRDLHTSNYEKALVIGKPADTLQRMDVKNESGITQYIEEFNFKSFTEPGQLVITSKRSGFEADNRRLLMEYYSLADVTTELESDLKLQFSNVTKTKEIDIDDNIDSNTFTMSYHYNVDGAWNDGDKGTNQGAFGLWYFRFEPNTLYAYLNKSHCQEREYDYALAYPLNVRYRVIFSFPKDVLISDHFKTYENEAYYFDKQIEQLNSHTLQVDYNLRFKKSSIEANAYKDVCEQTNEIVTKLPIVVYFSK